LHHAHTVFRYYIAAVKSMQRIRFTAATGANLEVSGGSVRLSTPGLWRDPHGCVKQIHHEELEDGEKERPSPFPKIMLKQTDSDIQ
jgi:hypothetical protein